MNPHLRIEKILTMIEVNSGITGQNIADACAVPWSIIKKDLETMLLSTKNRIPLYTDQDDVNNLEIILEQLGERGITMLNNCQARSQFKGTILVTEWKENPYLPSSNMTQYGDAR